FLSAKKLWNPFKELSFSNAQQDVSRLASAKVLSFCVMAKLFWEKFRGRLREKSQQTKVIIWCFSSYAD
ncbi:MAG: hypothetical protein ACI353_00035, partial [Alloprevotella sp.]